MDELLNITDARIVIQDPRTSTPGLGLLTWMKILYGENACKLTGNQTYWLESFISTWDIIAETT